MTFVFCWDSGHGLNWCHRSGVGSVGTISLIDSAPRAPAASVGTDGGQTRRRGHDVPQGAPRAHGRGSPAGPHRGLLAYAARGKQRAVPDRLPFRRCAGSSNTLSAKSGTTTRRLPCASRDVLASSETNAPGARHREGAHLLPCLYVRTASGEAAALSMRPARGAGRRWCREARNRSPGAATQLI